MQELLYFFLGTLLTSFLAAVNYTIYRKLERKARFFPYLGASLGLVVYGLLIFLQSRITIPDDDPAPASVWAFLVHNFGPLFILAVPSLFGAWFHRKSGGASDHFVPAFLLIFATTVLTIIGSWITLSVYTAITDYMTSPPHFLSSMLFYSFLIGALIYPALTPLALWMWKSSKVRPGLDVPGED